MQQRIYELGFIVEPRQNDEEVQALTERFQGMIEDSGSKVAYIDHWGKRKLAYPIRKFNEGKYVFLYVTSDESVPPWPDIERLMLQDERILRHLVVRTDEDLKRALRKGKVKPKIKGITYDPSTEEEEETDDSPARNSEEEE